MPLPATQSPVQGSPAGRQPGAPGMTPRVSGSSAPACHVPGLALLRFVPTAQQTWFPQPPTTEGGCLCPVAQWSHVSWLPVPAGSGGAGDQSPRTPRTEREGHRRELSGSTLLLLYPQFTPSPISASLLRCDLTPTCLPKSWHQDPESSTRPPTEGLFLQRTRTLSPGRGTVRLGRGGEPGGRSGDRPQSWAPAGSAQCPRVGWPGAQPQGHLL